MTANDRIRARADRRASRIRADFASEIRDARIRTGLSQQALGQAVGMSGDKIWQIEHERLRTFSFLDACHIGAVLGLDLSARLYPNGTSVRDAAQARRLLMVLSNVEAPLSHRTDVPLPRLDDRVELRAWDAVIYGHHERTAVELESRLGDVQDMTRRHNLKRRDDPVEHFLLVVADTRHNRRVVAEYGDLLSGLPKLRTATVFATLRAGLHPATGLMFV